MVVARIGYGLRSSQLGREARWPMNEALGTSTLLSQFLVCPDHPLLSGLPGLCSFGSLHLYYAEHAQ